MRACGDRSEPGQCSTLLRLPLELRRFIYAYLLDASKDEWIPIRSLPEEAVQKGTSEPRRSQYYVLDALNRSRSYRTTYVLEPGYPAFHASILAANHQVYTEGAEILYGGRCFDFGLDIEAVAPFFQDRTIHSRGFIRGISIRKIAPAFQLPHDAQVWATMCSALATDGLIRKLQLTVEAIRTKLPCHGPAEYSAEDFKAFCDMKHASLDWARDFKSIKGVKELEVSAHYLDDQTAMGTTAAIVFAAYSASIERGLADFLKREMISKA
ncbi:hypothetical protein GQ53DRAFT_743779 [Thozetella sp. PMI_491]|nr:hypothetical protein GQ53DRAFT_743779 [Thozetella sp. PMI_491]